MVTTGRTFRRFFSRALGRGILTPAEQLALRVGQLDLRYGRLFGFNGEVNGERRNFGSGTFRFKSDGSKMEFLHQYNNNTWGIGLNEQGGVFGSTANNNPSFFGGVPSRVHDGQRRMTAKMIASSPRFHPITPNVARWMPSTPTPRVADMPLPPHPVFPSPGEIAGLSFADRPVTCSGCTASGQRARASRPSMPSVWLPAPTVVLSNRCRSRT